MIFYHDGLPCLTLYGCFVAIEDIGVFKLFTVLNNDAAEVFFSLPGKLVM